MLINYAFKNIDAYVESTIKLFEFLYLHFYNYLFLFLFHFVDKNDGIL